MTGSHCESAVHTDQESPEQGDFVMIPAAGMTVHPVDFLRQLPGIRINDGFVGVLHLDPLILRFINLLVILVGHRARLVLHHVADVCFVPAEYLDRHVIPQSVASEVVGLPLHLKEMLPGRGNSFSIQD